MTAVLITGANRGLGLGLAQEYAADGVDVIACCRDPGGADQLRELASVSRFSVRILQLDVGDHRSIASLKSILNDQPIDIVVNNAAVVGPKEQSPDGIDAEGWVATLRVNALAPMLIALALHKNLLQSCEKKLIAISSRWGSTGYDIPPPSNARDRYAYRASKAALNNSMRALSKDWAEQGILVGILHPGWVRSNPADAAAAASPLAMDPAQSARRLIQQIDRLNAATSGTFLDHQGQAVPW